VLLTQPTNALIATATEVPLAAAQQMLKVAGRLRLM
jgi:hypothetical protein